MIANLFRHSISSFGGIGFAVVLFMTMNWLLSRPASPVNASLPVLQVERVRLKEFKKPEVTPQPPTPSVQTPARPNSVAPVKTLAITSAAFVSPLASVDFSDFANTSLHSANVEQSWGVVDSSLVVLSRIDPVYPPSAARRGIEGWVKLKFNVSPNGKVDGATIIEAEPANIFNRSALHAIQQWRFKPRSVNGQQVTTSVVQTLKFRIDT